MNPIPQVKPGDQLGQRRALGTVSPNFQAPRSWHARHRFYQDIESFLWRKPTDGHDATSAASRRDPTRHKLIIRYRRIVKSEHPRRGYRVHAQNILMYTI